MILYWDLLIFFNFIINFIFLFSMEMIFKDKVYFLRLILVSLICSVLAMLCFFNKIMFNIYKIIGGIVIVVFSLKKITASKTIIKISMFYIENLALTGVLATLKVNNLLMLIIAIILILGLLFFEHFKKYYIFIAKNKYNVIVSKNNVHLKMSAILDTGNAATNADGVPLVFVSEKLFSDVFDKYELVEIQTVNGDAYCKAYYVDDFQIVLNRKKIEKKAMVVFTKIDDDCLLNSMLLI